MKKVLLYLTIVIFTGSVAYSVFIQQNKEKVPGKLNRLACHKNITSFERAYDQSQLNEAKKSLLNGNYTIKSDIDKAIYMESSLFTFINIEDTDKYLYDQIKKRINKERVYNNGVIIEYTIYENDIEDPKKKSDKCKLFRGYIVLKVKNNNKKTLYQVQIDFMDYKGKDIYKTLDCSLESFLTY